MALFENFPYTNLHELNLDWIVQTVKDFNEHYDEVKEDITNKVNKPVNNPNGNPGNLLQSDGAGGTEWIDYDAIVAPKIQNAVTEWLDDHPEATTTVEDESITSKKLNKNYIPFYCVTDYDILPDIGDVYVNLHTLLQEKVAATGGIVYFPKGKYTISYTVFIPENTIFVGDGEETEIYFNEEDTTCGIGLSNAGSNILICNMKLSQASTGTFHEGSQPGCIGFSNWDKSMIENDPYSHLFHYNTTSPVHDLRVENVSFNGFYALQTETTEQGEIYNVTYKNITAPLSCVSIKPTINSKISSVSVENVYCDLFRIRGTRNVLTSGTLENCNLHNIRSASYYFKLESSNSKQCIKAVNLSNTGVPRNNDISAYELWISANIVFENCIFDLSTRIYIYQVDYTRIFKDCILKSSDRIFIAAGTLSTDGSDKTLFIYCDISQEASGGNVLGYGFGNKVSGTVNRIYGDTHTEKRLDTNSPTGYFANILIHDFGTNHLHYYSNQVTNTGNIFAIPENMELLRSVSNAFPAVIWNSSTPNVRIPTFARVVDGVVKIVEPAYSNSTAYNCVLICTPVEISAVPSMSGIYYSLD